MLYLSGPMSGMPAFNIPAFDAAAKELRAAGHTVIVPHELPHGVDTTWETAVRADLIALLHPECRTIVMLPGWQCSRGACLEHYIALKLGFKIHTYVAGEPLA